MLKQEGFNNIYRSALKTALGYLIAAGGWILITDYIVFVFFSDSDFKRMQTIKGLVFVFITTLLTFYMAFRFLKRVNNSQEQLKNSEEKFSVAFHKIPHLLAITRLSDGKIIDANEEILRTFGYTKEEVIGKTTIELGNWLTEDERNKYIKSYSKDDINSQLALLRVKTGEVKIFHGSFENLKINGEDCVISILQDVTENKQNEQKIIKLSRFNSFISQINQAIIRNQDAAKLFNEICRITVEYGKLHMAWIGMIDNNTGNVIPVATGGFVEGYLNEVRMSVNDEPEGNGMTGSAIKSRKYCVVNDIEVNPIFDNCRKEAIGRNYRSAIAYPIFINGDVVGAFMLYSTEPEFFNNEEISLLEDVSANISYALSNIEIANALTQSEAKLRSFLNSNDIFMSIVEMVDCDVIFSWPNQHMADFFGLTVDQLKGRSASALGIPGDTIKVIFEALKECDKNQRSTSFEYSLFKENKKRWYLGDINLIEVQAFEKSKFSLAAIDITELKETESKLIEAKEKALEADRLKSEFLAQMSHEIRSPINVILNYVSLLKEEIHSQLTRDLQYSFTAIENSARRLIRTIDLILNMAQVQTGKIELQPRTINLYKEILTPIISEFSSSAAAKGLELKLQKNTESTTIKIDEYTTSHIFVNLIDNAIKYTPSGSISVLVYRNDNNLLSVEVNDSGIGISEEFIKDLFIPFRQEEGGYTRRFEGNGLGLALVKNYCDLNYANVTVESKKGKGTKFTISFSENNVVK